MKAVIPAAGLGTRFLPLTKEQPKEMLPVVDRPVIHWVVEEAVKSGATDILIITGREKRALEDYFDSPHPALASQLHNDENAEGIRALEEISEQADIHFIRQRRPRGLGDAILHARRHVGKEPFLVILGDTINVAEKPVAKQLMDVHDVLGYSVVAIEKVRQDKISSYGIIAGKRIEERLLRIEDLVEKPSPSEAPSDWGISGTYVLRPSIFGALDRTTPGLNGEIQLTDALRLLMEDEPIYGYVFEGRRYDIGTKLDWFKAHLELTLNRDEFRAPLTRFMKEWLDGG